MSRLNLHAIEPRSRANGPGVRFVLWFQGCSLGCPGCFNPGTHDDRPRTVHDVGEIVDRIEAAARASAPIEGVTLSGGEPFQQPEGALALVERVRALSALPALPALSIVAFSGYTIDEIRGQPLGPAILAHLDALVDGRYQAPARLARGLRGSTNQQIHLLSDRYRRAEIEATPEAEIRIDPNGNVILTGVDPLRVRGKPL